MQDACKFIHIVTSDMHQCIVTTARLVMPILENVEAFIDETCSSPDLLEIDHNTQRHLAIMLNSCEKVDNVIRIFSCQ